MLKLPIDHQAKTPLVVPLLFMSEGNWAMFLKLLKY